MRKRIECPICPDGIAHLKEKKMSVVFRGSRYEIKQRFYLCDSCKQEFQTEEQLTDSLQQIPGYPLA